jgi:hypothetical protein
MAVERRNVIFVEPEDALTLSSIRVFNAIRDRNLEFISNLVNDWNDVQDIMDKIYHSKLVGATDDEIIAYVKDEFGVDITPKDIERDVAILFKHKLVKVRLPADQTDRNTYYVLVLTVDSLLELPHPRMIKDPVLNGEKVEVTNPITGYIEVI